MIILPNTSSSLEVILAGVVTTNQLPIVANWVDVLTADQSVSAFGESDLLTNSNVAVTVVAAPVNNHTRTIKSLTIFNADTVNATVTVRYNNGSTTRIMTKVTLATGETLEYVE